jgi:hypothetical protein
MLPPSLGPPKGISLANSSVCAQCGGARPRCAFCLARNIDCKYETATEGETHGGALKRKYAELHEQKSTFEEIYEILRGRPFAEANEVFTRIRGGADPETVLRYVKDGDLLLQLALTPETRYRYDFPFIQEMPAFLLRPDNPYLDTLIYECTFSNASTSRSSTSSTTVAPLEHRCLYLRPFHAADLLEPLLASVKPSEWTSINSDDELMRKLFAAFFMNEYITQTCFQKESFLEDMAAKRRRFCSTLLVNAVLAYASVRGSLYVATSV